MADWSPDSHLDARHERVHEPGVQVRHYYGPARKKPREGDRRVTKAHGVQYRVQEIAREPATGRPIGYRVSNGRPVYEWKAAAELVGTRYEHHLTPEDRAALAATGDA